MNTYSLLHMLAVGFLCCLGGCHESSGARDEAAPTGAVIAKEHLDHVIPDHKPHDFPDAVREIARRDRALREEIAEGHAEHILEELNELLDILNWIPDLAADSELRKAEWDGVRTAAQQLKSIYEPLRNATAGKIFLADGELERQIDSTLHSFEALVAKYPGGFEPVFGDRLGDGDDHHHHHHH